MPEEPRADHFGSATVRKKLLPRSGSRWPTGTSDVRRAVQGLGGLVGSLRGAGGERIGGVEIFIPADGIYATVMGLAAEACHDGENGEGGTEGWVHKSGSIITSRAHCARRGNRESLIPLQGITRTMRGLPGKHHPATNQRWPRSQPPL